MSFKNPDMKTSKTAVCPYCKKFLQYMRAKKAGINGELIYICFDCGRAFTKSMLGEIKIRRKRGEQV